jgi:hypothetical protein
MRPWGSSAVLNDAGAKAAETRARRLATTVERMAEGKSRNWRYEKC